MTKTPNVDWSQINWSQMTMHPTDARQDNMRAVHSQFGGSAVAPMEAGLGSAGCGTTQGNQAPPPDGVPDFWPAYQPTIGVGESIFTAEQIAEFREKAINMIIASEKEAIDAQARAYVEACLGIDPLAEQRYLEGDTEFSDKECNCIRCYAEGNHEPGCPRYVSEFSDQDVEDYYLGKGIAGG